MADVMTSVDKVRAAIDRLDELEPTEPAAQAMVLALTMLRPQVLAQLPAEPAELDELLLRGALWALQLRSDDAKPLAVRAPAQTGPELEAAAPAGEAAA